MRRIVIAIAIALAALVAAASGGQAAPSNSNLRLLAEWYNTLDHVPAPSRSTITHTRMTVVSDKAGYRVDVSVNVSEERVSGRGARDWVSSEEGSVSVPRTALTVRDDLSAATLSRIQVPLHLQIKTCPPETPGDCSWFYEFNRTITIDATWAANEAFRLECDLLWAPGVVAEHQPTVSTGSFNGIPLGDSATLTGGDFTGSFIMRFTKTRC
jgi:hypothetical protein